MPEPLEHFSTWNHAVDLVAVDQDHTRDFRMCFQMRRNIFCNGFDGYLIIMRMQLTYRYWGVLLPGGQHENCAGFGFHSNSVNEVN